jgi:hypothetical protein
LVNIPANAGIRCRKRRWIDRRPLLKSASVFAGLTAGQDLRFFQSKRLFSD